MSLIKPSVTQLGLEQNDLIESQANVIETQMHGRSYITLYVFGKPEICTSRELKSLSDAQTPSPSTFDIPYSSAIYPNTVVADNIVDPEGEIRTLTMACAVDDAVELSIFPTGELTTRVRRSPQTLEPTSTTMEVFRDLLSFSSIPLNQLRVKIPITGNISPSLQKLSTDLLYACKDGDAARVESLIRIQEVIEGALIEVETENFHSFRPLHWATIGGHMPIIHLLLSAGAHEYPYTSQDMTPIHLAAMVGHLEIIMYFFEKATHTGLKIDALLEAKTSGTLETPYHLAAAYSRPEAAESFLNALYTYGENRQPAISSANYLDETPLHRAAAMNNAEAVRYILKLKPKVFHKEAVHVVDKFGRSPLWHAACGGSSESIRALAFHGAILDLADDCSRTPLDVACIGGRTDAVSALLRLGANPNCAAQPLGLTPCHYAALFGHVDCLHLLIQYKADFDAYTSHLAQFKPIHLAAANGWIKCVEELYYAGSKPDSPSTHYIILEADGTSANLVSRQTQSAEEMALLQGHSNIVQYFKNAMAARQKENERITLLTQEGRGLKQGQTVMDLGTLEGDPNAVIVSPSNDAVQNV